MDLAITDYGEVPSRIPGSKALSQDKSESSTPIECDFHAEGSNVIWVNPWPHPPKRAIQLKEIGQQIAQSPFAHNRAAVADTLLFLRSLPPTIPVPSSAVGEDGETYLEWFLGFKKAVAIFDGDGKFNFLLRIEGDYEGGVADIPRSSNSFPLEFLEYIRRHSG